jgi:hypothetical protein
MLTYGPKTICFDALNATISSESCDVWSDWFSSMSICYTKFERKSCRRCSTPTHVFACTNLFSSSILSPIDNFLYLFFKPSTVNYFDIKLIESNSWSSKLCPELKLCPFRFIFSTFSCFIMLSTSWLYSINESFRVF